MGRAGTQTLNSNIVAGDADRLCLGTVQSVRDCPLVLLVLYGEARPNNVCALLRRFAGLAFHPAAGEELFQPVDVIVAVDDVLFAHEGAKKR